MQFQNVTIFQEICLIRRIFWSKYIVYCKIQTLCYEASLQSKFPTRPTASKPFIVWSDCVYVIE